MYKNTNWKLVITKIVNNQYDYTIYAPIKFFLF